MAQGIQLVVPFMGLIPSGPLGLVDGGGAPAAVTGGGTPAYFLMAAPIASAVGATPSSPAEIAMPRCAPSVCSGVSGPVDRFFTSSAIATIAKPIAVSGA